jgi:hypothetical protein
MVLVFWGQSLLGEGRIAVAERAAPRDGQGAMRDEQGAMRDNVLARTARLGRGTFFWLRRLEGGEMPLAERRGVKGSFAQCALRAR